MVFGLFEGNDDLCLGVCFRNRIIGNQFFLRSTNREMNVLDFIRRRGKMFVISEGREENSWFLEYENLNIILDFFEYNREKMFLIFGGRELKQFLIFRVREF